MPLLTSNPGALITTVGGIQSCRIALYVNSIAALQVRTAARQGEWWWETRALKFMSSGSNKVKVESRMVVWWLFPPCFVPSDANFRISLRERTLGLRTDESAPSPGGSSSAKRSDLAAGPTCSARTAPRYGEAPPMIWSRRTFEVGPCCTSEGSVAVRRPDLSRGHSGF